MKKVSKILFTIMLIIMISSMAIAPVFALGTDPKNFNGDSNTDVNKITGLGNQAITVISTAGSIISVIILVVLGIKYMMGSAEEKAEYKKTLLPYIIGAVFIFAASTIASVIFGFANTL